VRRRISLGRSERQRDCGITLTQASKTLLKRWSSHRAGPPTSVATPSTHRAPTQVQFGIRTNKDLTVLSPGGQRLPAGRRQQPAPITCPKNALQYNPDGLWSYELGEKARFFDNRLTINSAVYYENWTDIQQFVYGEMRRCSYL